MDYYKFNYNKLINMKIINYYKFVIFITILITILLIISNFIYINKDNEFYGVYNNNILTIKMDLKLSDELKKHKYIVFKNIKTKFNIEGIVDTEIIDNNVYQSINIILDKKFMDNEVGIVKISSKQKLIKYILELFN